MELQFPVVYPTLSVSNTNGMGRVVPDFMDFYHGVIRLIHAHRIPSRTMERIHSMIRAPFHLLIENLQRWNRLGDPRTLGQAC